jgi:enoyl-CoA hydratase
VSTASRPKPSVALDIADSIAVITLNRPDAHNAIDTAMTHDLRELCDDVDACDDIAGAVITGAGRSFCSGADVAILRHISEDPFLRLSRLRCPTIAAINGSAVGAGLNLALATDVRIVASDARILCGFRRLGVHPGGGNLTMLSRLVGREVATAMTLFDAELDGQRAVAAGFAWKAVSADKLLEEALALASILSTTDPRLVRSVTHSLRVELGGSLPIEVAVEFERGKQLRSLRNSL